LKIRLHQVSVPTHLRSMNLKTRTRRSDKNIERCAVWNQLWTNCSTGVERA
jgi:hypothetical protein